MKKLILALVMPVLASLSLVGPAQAAPGGIEWDKFPAERITDMAALQNGAKMFANYCLNCHAAAFMRYNRLRDIGLTEEQIASNLIFTGAKVGDTMKVALDPKDAKAWFGKVPPDLTLVARSRSAAGKGTGADYLYTYLRTYYRDDSTLTGWNNLAYPTVGMPHVLWELQGQQRAVYESQPDPRDATKTVQVFKGFEQITPGTMTQVEYNAAMADLVAFLKWMAEPNQNDRKRLGVWVLAFLAVFTVIAWRLNAVFWKDIK
jgi:ubiquinol-cytochrome c reductase cytochrome c1 subunit